MKKTNNNNNKHNTKNIHHTQNSPSLTGDLGDASKPAGSHFSDPSEVWSQESPLTPGSQTPAGGSHPAGPAAGGGAAEQSLQLSLPHLRQSESRPGAPPPPQPPESISAAAAAAAAAAAEGVHEPDSPTQKVRQRQKQRLLSPPDLQTEKNQSEKKLKSPLLHGGPQSTQRPPGHRWVWKPPSGEAGSPQKHALVEPSHDAAAASVVAGAPAVHRSAGRTGSGSLHQPTRNADTVNKPQINRNSPPEQHDKHNNKKSVIAPSTPRPRHNSRPQRTSTRATNYREVWKSGWQPAR